MICFLFWQFTFLHNTCVSVFPSGSKPEELLSFPKPYFGNDLFSGQGQSIISYMKSSFSNSSSVFHIPAMLSVLTKQYLFGGLKNLFANKLDQFWPYSSATQWVKSCVRKIQENFFFLYMYCSITKWSIFSQLM